MLTGFEARMGPSRSSLARGDWPSRASEDAAKLRRSWAGLVGVLALLARAKGGAIRRRIGTLEIDELARTATVAGRRLELRIEF